MTTPTRANPLQLPNFTSPQKEKEELALLNTRLLQFTDHVRQLKEENEALKEKLNAARPSGVHDKLYEDEIKALRRELEDVKKEKSMIERSAAKRYEEAKEATEKAAELSRKLNDTERASIANQQKVEELLKDLDFQRRLSQEEKKSLADQVAGLQLEIEDLKRKWREEIQREIERERRTLKDFYENEREHLLNAHAEVVEQLQSNLANLETENTNLKVELSSLRRLLDDAVSKVAPLKSEIQILKTKIDQMSEDSSAEIAKLKERIKAKEDDLRAKERELRDLKEQHGLSIIDLNPEIKLYKRIIEEEEKRLGIKRKREENGDDSPPPRALRGISGAESGFAVASSPIKFNVTKKGVAEIHHFDPEKRHLSVINISHAPISLAGWRLEVTGSRDEPQALYSFPNVAELQANGVFEVPIHISKEGDIAEGCLSLRSDLIHPGTFVRLFDRRNNIVSQAELTDERFSSEGVFSRSCPLM